MQNLRYDKIRYPLLFVSDDTIRYDIVSRLLQTIRYDKIYLCKTIDTIRYDFVSSLGPSQREAASQPLAASSQPVSQPASQPADNQTASSLPARQCALSHLAHRFGAHRGRYDKIRLISYDIGRNFCGQPRCDTMRYQRTGPRYDKIRYAWASDAIRYDLIPFLLVTIQ